MISPNSRYVGVAQGVYVAEDGREIPYIRRRFIPPPEQYALLHEHEVVEGERPDTLSAGEFGDPDQFWRICDANAVIDPHDLTRTPGTRVRITLPAGVPAPTIGE